MHFSNTVLAFGACFSQLAVMVQGFAFTEWPKEIHPGESTMVKWDGASSAVCAHPFPDSPED